MADVLLVTGASAGIGRACAERMHHAGWTVLGASRRGTSSGGWQPVIMDVDDDESVATPWRRDRRAGAVELPRPANPSRK